MLSANHRTRYVSFDAEGNPTKAAVILQIKDGQQVYVATVSP